jgi:hypothetical protein
MFERFRRSWELVKASWSVLRADKELILFPIVSLIGTLVVMAVFAVPALLVGAVNDEGLSIAGYVLLFLFYLVMYSVIIFSNTALVGAAMIRLNGGDPTVMDGFNIAFSKLGLIIQFAAISATVGLVLQMLRERGGILAEIAAWLGSMAWNIATFLVIPVLVVENVSAIEAIKRSTALLKQTWGEQIVGNFGLGMIFGLINFAVVVLGLVLIGAMAATGSIALIIAAVGLTILLLMAVNLVASAMNGIYTAAVYRYAVNGEVSAYFNPEMIQGAFRPK